MKTKNLLYETCCNFLRIKEATIMEAIASNKSDLFSETKNSAGDKHETGRAMIQLEMEKASQQLLVASEMKETLQKLTIEKPSKNVKLGSLVKTTKGIYFLAVSIGKITIENKEYFVISTNSPIGKQLLGKKNGEQILFNNATIREIY